MSASPAKIGINGLGRIGREIVRSAIQTERDDVQIVAINDPGMPIEAAAHLLVNDSIKGRLQADVQVKNQNTLSINGNDIAFTDIRDPKVIGWDNHDVDIVMECTGIFTKKTAAEQHIEGGAKKVLISAPAGDADQVIVYGVNHELIKPENTVISNASCTTNCLAPVAQVLHEQFGIASLYMVTTHAYTSDQRLQDAPHSDLSRARGAAQSIIPTSTGAAKTVGLVIPELAGKLDGESNRVPTPNVSLVNATILLDQKDVTPEQVNDAIRQAADGRLKDILGYVDEENDPTAPRVSVDFNSAPYSRLSSAFVLSGTKMTGELLSIRTWYDNEAGFSNRMSDTAALMHAVGYDN